MYKLLFIIVGYLFNAVLLYLMSKCIKNFNILRWLCLHLPTWLGGTLSFILLIGICSVTGVMAFRFGAYVYDAFIISNVTLLVKYLIVDVICMFLLYITTNKLIEK